MTLYTRIVALKYAMIAIGVIFTFAICPPGLVWPHGWTWGAGHSHYLPMILGVYAILGIFLIAGSRDPLANRSLNLFFIWSSVVHALIMAVQAFTDPSEVGHLLGDVPALLIAASALAWLMPRGATLRAVRELESRRAA